MSKVNQKKLALLAGVSVSTVSKAFSGSHEISEETRDSIFALASVTAALTNTAAYATKSGLWR